MIELPELHEGTLSPDEVRALAHDLAAHAEQLEVLPKGGARAYAGARISLSAAVDALLAKRLYGLQLRYVHAGSLWTDTLLPRDGAYRLIRMQG